LKRGGDELIAYCCELTQNIGFVCEIVIKAAQKRLEKLDAISSISIPISHIRETQLTYISKLVDITDNLITLYNSLNILVDKGTLDLSESLAHYLRGSLSHANGGA